ncbi:hypothetical protein SCHPADRAFT_64278 [Schizopora paradoxa]|uniref:DASH complex subunit DAD2 n=1 Tax=Schizopora paradoxa TaxID=27342 RepID=A0A0H2S6E0_9AGAM|nr:hypothetical protein SCHPADRAFT_64278 [Schizopora paradoxa]
MRKSSVHSVRASSSSSSHASAAASQAAQTYLLEKMKEYAALEALERTSADYVRRMENIDLDCNLMADAGKVLGEVHAQWPEMFRILSLAVPQKGSSDQQADGAEGNECEILVRVPLDELQQQQDEILK